MDFVGYLIIGAPIWALLYWMIFGGLERAIRRDECGAAQDGTYRAANKRMSE